DGVKVDQVITLRFPSYAVRHPRQVCWLNHTMREYYDLWDEFRARLSPQGRVKERVRRALIHAADRHFLRHNVYKLFAQSAEVQQRLEAWNGVESEVLHPPAPPRPYRCDEYGDYLFFASRLVPLKRADLVLRAMGEPAAAAVRCVIGGEGPERDALERLAAELRLGDRVRFAGRLSEDALVEHYARCRAVLFVPRREDYGFVTAEAFASRKAVITCADSGGPLEFVSDDRTGFVTAPEPAALAVAMARLAADKALAERLGGEAARIAAPLTWPNTIARLVVV
ncbi:MAG TPA: glycosyltransferase, partial [Vicinamibacterales bacterium]|nr:glycosyltransferase [Vicinamibacterales bacterium]